MLTLNSVYNLTLAPEQENPWYHDGHQTTSCDRFHRCHLSKGYWASGGTGLHVTRALAVYLILYASMPSRPLLIPIMKIKDLFVRLPCLLEPYPLTPST